MDQASSDHFDEDATAFASYQGSDEAALLRDDHENETLQQIENVDNPASTKQRLTFINGLALVIGLQIGSGVFTAPSLVSRSVSSPAFGVSAWVVSGLLVWTGAACFIELGLCIPRNGGIQEYLYFCYGDLPAFLFSWMWCLIIKPCAMALVSIVFAENLCRGFAPGSWLSPLLTKLIALIGLIVIVIINCKEIKTGARVGNVFLAIKLLAVFSVGLLCLGYLFFTPGNHTGSPSQPPPRSDTDAWSAIGNYVTAIFAVLFCYGGWETVGFVAGDMQDPARDLSKVINTSMATVITGFVLMMSSLYIVVPVDVLRGSNTPIVEFGISLLSSFGGQIYSILAAICALGALHSQVFSTARLCIAAAKRFLKNVSMIFGFVQKVANGQDRSLVSAVLFSALPATGFIVGGTFDRLVVFYGISEYLFFALTVLGIFRLRSLEPQARQHRTWTLNPVIFSIALGITLICLVGIALYLYTFRWPQKGSPT